jgi:hypothetical protein
MPKIKSKKGGNGGGGNVVDFPAAKSTPPMREVFTPVKTAKLEFADLVEGIDYHYENFRPADLVVFLQKDGGYQRDPILRMPKLRGIARKFSPAAIGVLHVWFNKTTRQFETIDGTGRRHVMLHLLDPVYNEPVKCVVHDHITTTKQAARWFLILNPDETTKVTEKNKWGARLLSRDKDAVRILDTVKGCAAPSAVVGGGGKHGISVQAAYALDHMGVLMETVVLKNTVWPNDKLGGPEWVGLGAYIVATRDLSSSLKDKLKKTSADELNREIRKDHDMGHGRVHATRFARQILAVRNAKSSKPVGASWSRVDDLMATHPWSDRWAALAA